ncbi:murein hydrolase activator NlpD [uncultured Gilliamella sp.]|uniref:murein hydrolase activator NlpD n=1 Tax=uncultured Gilliamella sp. TaxID=1193505 RepID=UPI0025F5C708|nr:murein hydrolase activator NlpD [uncultured Gilliamella sp.]
MQLGQCLLTKGVALKKTITLSCLSLMIVACTQTNPAQIEDISDSSSGSISSVYTKPPTNISTKGTISSSPSTSAPTYSTAEVSSSPTDGIEIANNERIVYNRNYDEIPKGGYQGDTYTVKRGDTLFYIAWVTGNDYRSLAAKNNISEPYAVSVGQVLDVSGYTTVIVTEKVSAGQNSSSNSTSNSGTAKSKTKPVMTTTTTITSTSNKSLSSQIKQTTKTVTNPVSNKNNTSTKSPNATSNVANITWRWPARGKVIVKYSSASKGIDIASSYGDKVMAAADGRVVYSGNALPGYGNLIIIKHNDDYLTAYAHNQSILVKEQQSVRAGEQIATMGATGTSSVRLHFEIRYRAQSVDPLNYLPLE